MNIFRSGFFSSSDLSDLPPALVPAPPKRARPSPGHLLAEHEDPEERLNRHDQHITAVLTKIIVRLTWLNGTSHPRAARVGLVSFMNSDSER